MIMVEHLTKCYGDFMAVDNLSFEIEEGHVYGFLGPNGAGKTTTMNIMTGCLSATEGHIRIDGHDIFEEPNEAKRLIGYLPEQPPLYMNETPAEYLYFVGKAKGLRGAELERQIEEVLEQTKITHMRNRRISKLSKGYKQRVGIAQALLGNPKVIILDEPTVGLDPLQIIEIRDLIKELGQNHTVIFSSHILSEVQAICDQILIINKGKLIAFDEPANLEKMLVSPSEIHPTTDASLETVQEILSSIEEISNIQVRGQQGSYTMILIQSNCEDMDGLSKSVFQAFASTGNALMEMSVKKANLEDIFLELTEEKTNSENENTDPVSSKDNQEESIGYFDEEDSVPEEQEVKEC